MPGCRVYNQAITRDLVQPFYRWLVATADRQSYSFEAFERTVSEELHCPRLSWAMRVAVPAHPLSLQTCQNSLKRLRG